MNRYAYVSLVACGLIVFLEAASSPMQANETNAEVKAVFDVAGLGAMELQAAEGVELLGRVSLADYATDNQWAIEATAFNKCLLYAEN